MMTREQFIAEAKRRGKSKEETFAKYKDLESKGAFDSLQPPGPQQQDQPKKQGIIAGIEERQRKQTERLLAPTTLGSIANRALNLNPRSVAGQTVEQIAGIPETTARNLSSLFETAGEPVGALVQLGGMGINKLFGGAPGRLAEKGLSKIVEQPTIQKGYQTLADLYKQMPESEKANLASIPGLIEGATMGPGSGVLANIGKKQLKKQVGNDFIKSTGKITKKQINKEIASELGEIPKKGWRNIGIPDEEAVFIKRVAQSETPGETTIPEIIKQAKAAKQGVYEGIPHPMDKAGELLVKAEDMIGSERQAIGKQMSDVISDIAQKQAYNGEFTYTPEIKRKAQKLLTKYLGGIQDEKGKIIKAAGREISAPEGDIGLAKKILTKFNGIDDAADIQQLWDVRKYIDDISGTYSQRPGAISSSVKAFGKELSSELDNIIKNTAGDEYKALSNRYKYLRDTQSQLGKRMQEVATMVDPATGEVTQRARNAAGMLKSSLNSMGDRNTKALFQNIKDITGMDLFREAGKADVAMKAVGDPRINSLLKSTGAMESMMTKNLIGKTIAVGEKGKEIFTGDKTDQLLRFYNRMKKQIKGR